MKRLTKKLLPYDPFGWVGGVYLAESKKTDLCPKTFCKNGTKCDLNQDRTCPFLAALDRLAEYEDTGLMPDEIEKMKAPRDWTPCAEGLPKSDQKLNGFDVQYPVTVVGKKYNDRYTSELCYIRNAWREDDDSGAVDTSKREVIAWRPPITPYRADDTTGKVKEE